MQARSRLAPTPSGYLHLGNAVNFLLTWLLVRADHGTLKLRIDDADRDRVRPEFIADIFTQLDWLELTWDEGPTGPDDLHRHHSQLRRLERYRQVLDHLDRQGHLFACVCSRQAIKRLAGNGPYPGTCRELNHRPDRPHAVRVRVPAGSRARVDNTHIDLARVMGDFVLWRRDRLPAYQLASIVDDIDDRMNLIVRGVDLLESTAAQLFLAEKIGNNHFQAATFHHHPLLTDPAGAKLSKSDNALSLAIMRAGGTRPHEVYRLTAQRLGLPAAEIRTLDDLLAVFCAARRKNGPLTLPSQTW